MTTKTVVVKNDIHKAIEMYSARRDRSIQEVVDSILRGDEDLQEDVMTEYNYLQKQGDLPN